VSPVTLSDGPPRAGPLASKLQREIVLLLAWSPAILLQLAHPLVARGVADHSTFRTERYGWCRRLHRTVDAMLRLSFGTERDAQVAVDGSTRSTIACTDTCPRPKASSPPGRPTRPTTRRSSCGCTPPWVHMNLRVYELFVDRMAPEDRDHYCAEATTIERGLGIPVGWLPRSATELDRYMDGMLARGEIAVTDTAVPWPARFSIPTSLGLVRRPPPSCVSSPSGSCRQRSGPVMAFPGARGATRPCGLAWHVRALLRLTPPVLCHWPAARAAARRSECPEAALRSPRA
jgi:uncharacterized protein (DUF2236 family)